MKTARLRHERERPTASKRCLYSGRLHSAACSQMNSSASATQRSPRSFARCSPSSPCAKKVRRRRRLSAGRPENPTDRPKPTKPRLPRPGRRRRDRRPRRTGIPAGPLADRTDRTPTRRLRLPPLPPPRLLRCRRRRRWPGLPAARPPVRPPNPTGRTPTRRHWRAPYSVRRVVFRAFSAVSCLSPPIRRAAPWHSWSCYDRPLSMHSANKGDATCGRWTASIIPSPP